MSTLETTETAVPALELDDIQGGVLHSLPLPYVGVFLLYRIDDARDGRALLRDLIPHLRSAQDPTSAAADAWISVAITYTGLEALGLPEESLASFAAEFRAGMSSRAEKLHDIGESAPAEWEEPFGSKDLHLAITVMAPDQARLDGLLERAGAVAARHTGVTQMYRQDCFGAPDGREAFGYKDNISQPAIEGSGILSTNPHDKPAKAGEFVFGYPDESGTLPPIPVPEVLGRNGTYIVIRKLQQRVAAFRQYLQANAEFPGGEEMVAAKIMGRWRSGAPLVLAPDADDPELGADPLRNNNFQFIAEGDDRGFKCPIGSHMRRMNPRDGEIFGDPRIRRLLRREASYGARMPEGEMTEDGVDRGVIFAAIGTSLRRQFEFVQEEWINSGIFIGRNGEKDPLVGANDGADVYTVPGRPIRRKLGGLPAFVVTRGGEYFFMPGLNALRWIAEPES